MTSPLWGRIFGASFCASFSGCRICATKSKKWFDQFPRGGGYSQLHFSAASSALCWHQRNGRRYFRLILSRTKELSHLRSRLRRVRVANRAALPKSVPPTRHPPAVSLHPVAAPRLTTPLREGLTSFLHGSDACGKPSWHRPACVPWRNSFCKIVLCQPIPEFKPTPAPTPRKMRERWPGWY
jgi:hypothetical protein